MNLCKTTESAKLNWLTNSAGSPEALSCQHLWLGLGMQTITSRFGCFFISLLSSVLTSLSVFHGGLHKLRFTPS